jgi:hypothetical protein
VFQPKYLILTILACTIQSQANTVPAATEIQLRLTSEVSSNQPSGQPVTSVVAAPVLVNGSLVINFGTKLTGSTSEVKPYRAATDQAQEEAATLKIHFTQITTPSGKSKSIACTLETVDNAREKVSDTGLITGILTSSTYAGQLDRGLEKLQGRYGQFGQILTGVKDAFLKQVDPSIEYKPGVDLTVKLTKNLDWDEPPSGQTAGPISPADALAEMVNAQPFRTVALKPPEPSDLTNLMLVGTLEQIKGAFQSAGWFSADALSQNSKMETARAIIENRGYNEAPMSVLTLDGSPPDLALQKQTNTFAMRHHIRIWKRPQLFNGKPVWVAAATHDTSITFSQTSKSFTHGIDPHIDAERAKVVNDLLFTGTVHGLALVERTGIPQDASNATGDKLLTDGKMAVLEF